MALTLSLANRDDRPKRLSIEPFLFADMRPGFLRHYSMPPGARWRILAPDSDVELELEICQDYVVVLATGCNVEDIEVIDRTTGEVHAIDDGRPDL